MTLHTLHRWTQGGKEWFCLAYDHGPMCRQCTNIPTDHHQSVVRMLLTEIEARDKELDRRKPFQVGLCQCKIDHDGLRPHVESKKNCMYWWPLAEETA